MAKKISRSMQRTYRRRRVGLLVLALVLVAGVSVALIGGVNWFLSDGTQPADDASEPGDEDFSIGEEGDPAANPETAPDANVEPEPEPDPELEPVAVVNYDDAWRLILASASSPLPDGYAPPELETITEHYQVDSRIAPQLRRMIADAKLEGINLLICSAFRDQAYQQTLFDKQVDQWRPYRDTEEEAIEAAATVVLYPGTSEHQTGLAVDIVTPEYQTLDDGFAETAAARWMAENSWKYGFVLRYPQDKQDITKVIFEPWHFRYVGEEHAKIIYEKGYCLEEYLYIELRQISSPEGAQAVVADQTEDPDADPDN